MIDILYWKSFLASEIIVFPDPFLVLIHEWGIKCAVICLLSVVCTNTPESLPGQDCVVTSRLPLNRKLRGDTAIHWPCGHVLSGDLLSGFLVSGIILLSGDLCPVTSIRWPLSGILMSGILLSAPCDAGMMGRCGLTLARCHTDCISLCQQILMENGEWKYGQSWKHHIFWLRKQPNKS